MNTIDALSYMFVILMFSTILVANINFLKDRGKVVNLVAHVACPGSSFLQEEGAGLFYWSETWGCYLGGNNDFLVLCGGGVYGDHPTEGLTIFVSDKMETHEFMCILAHERGHRDCGHEKVVGWLNNIIHEFQADREAILQVGRNFFLTGFEKHCQKLEEATIFATRWDQIKYHLQWKLRVVVGYLYW